MALLWAPVCSTRYLLHGAGFVRNSSTWYICLKPRCYGVSIWEEGLVGAICWHGSLLSVGTSGLSIPTICDLGVIGAPLVFSLDAAQTSSTVNFGKPTDLPSRE